MTRRVGVLTVLACLVLVFPLGAQESVIPPNENLVADGIPPIPAELVEEVRKYSETRTAAFVDWHPERREMIVSTRFGDTNQLHTVTTPLGARRQLTFFEDRVAGGVYQPTQGEYLLFAKDVGGGEFFQIFRLDLDTGDVTMLTDGESQNGTPVWNRLGDRIAYTSTRRNGTDYDLYVMDPANPATDRLLSEVEGGWFPTDWSPDGTEIAAIEYISINESYIWLIDATTGASTLVTPKRGGAKVSYGDAQFSADGSGLYVTTDQSGEFQQLTFLDLATRAAMPLSAHIPWDVDGFELSHDGSTIAAVTNEAGISKLHLIDTTTRQETPAPALPVGLIGSLAWHRNDRELGLTLTSARSPADAYSVDLDTGRLTRWTESETGGLNTALLSEPELVRWTSVDGMEISGFLYRPPARFTGPRPVIIDIHGGPEDQSRPAFAGRNNYFLNEMGVAIIRPNVRGSSGFGKTFLKADNGMNRHRSYQDIGALIDWIDAEPDLDGDRIMVTGGSYGGHMTLAIATRYNDRIRASVAVVAMSNLVTFLEHTESYRLDLRRAEYGDEREAEMRQYLSEQAPMFLAANITKPMFIIHGENDPRVPVSEAHQMVETARAHDTPVWLLIGKNEGHGFSRKANRDFQFYATIEFMREYLLK